MKNFLVPIFVFQIVWLAGCATTPGRSSTVYVQPVQQTTSQDDYNKRIIKQGLLGAATGAIAAETSGGKAGTGALVGAGTNVLGGALLDMLTAPQSQPQQIQQYAPYVQQWDQQNPNMNRVVRKFDSNGNVISEEVFKR